MRHRAGVDVVVAAAGRDDERVAFAAQAVGQHHRRHAGGAERDARALDAVLCVLRQRDRVGQAVRTQDGDGVGGTVVRDRKTRLFDRLAALGVVDELGAGAHHVLAGRKRHERQAGAGHVVQRDPVGTGARVHAQVFEVGAGDRAGRIGAALEVGHREAVAAQRIDAEVVRAGGADNVQDVVAGAAVDGGQRDVGIVPVDHVVAAVAVDRIGAAAPVDVVAAVATVDQVGAEAAVDVVAVGAAVDLGAAAAVVDDVVQTGAAVQEGEVAVAVGGEVVVAGVTVERSVAAAVVDEDVIAVAAVEFDVGGHAFLDVDVVVALAAEGHQLFDALEDGLAAAEHNTHGFAAGVRADMLDDVELVSGPLGYAAGGVAAAHVEVEHAV